MGSALIAIQSILIKIITLLWCSMVLSTSYPAEHLVTARQHVSTTHANAFDIYCWCRYMSFAFIAFQSILINIIGPTYFSMLSALLLILQLTSSAGIIASQLAQPFYRVGKALPFYYGVKGFRTIFFGAGLGRMW